MIRNLANLTTRVMKWWTTKADSQKQTSLAIVALVVSVMAIPYINDKLASPEEKLVKLGYHKTYEDFWRAVANKHPEAVDLFTKTGMRFDPHDFGRLFNDRVFNKDVFEKLEKGGAISSAHCPIGIKDLGLYRSVASNPDKLAAIRGACAAISVTAAIRASRVTEATRLSESLARNQGRPQRIASCTSKYQSESDQRLLTEASQFSLLSVPGYTERQCVLAHLNKELLLGTIDSSNLHETVVQSIHRCCQQYDPELQIDDAGIRAADDALAILE